MPGLPGSWLRDYTLTRVSLSGVVYESTATGRTPIARAVVYCEPCGVALAPGAPTPIAVGYYNKD